MEINEKKLTQNKWTIQIMKMRYFFIVLNETVTKNIKK